MILAFMTKRPVVEWDEAAENMVHFPSWSTRFLWVVSSHSYLLQSLGDVLSWDSVFGLGIWVQLITMMFSYFLEDSATTFDFLRVRISVMFVLWPENCYLLGYFVITLTTDSPLYNMTKSNITLWRVWHLPDQERLTGFFGWFNI